MNIDDRMWFGFTENTHKSNRSISLCRKYERNLIEYSGSSAEAVQEDRREIGVRHLSTSMGLPCLRLDVCGFSDGRVRSNRKSAKAWEVVNVAIGKGLLGKGAAMNPKITCVGAMPNVLKDLTTHPSFM